MVWLLREKALDDKISIICIFVSLLFVYCISRYKPIFSIRKKGALHIFYLYYRIFKRFPIFISPLLKQLWECFKNNFCIILEVVLGMFFIDFILLNTKPCIARYHFDDLHWIFIRSPSITINGLCHSYVRVWRVREKRIYWLLECCPVLEWRQHRGAIIKIELKVIEWSTWY